MSGAYGVKILDGEDTVEILNKTLRCIEFLEKHKVKKLI
jgi:hypothetical protein